METSMMFRSFVRPLTMALSLAFATAAAAPAFADEGGPAKVTEHENHGKGKDKDHDKGGKARPRIERPIKADKFSAHVAAHLAKAKERLTEAMKTGGVAETTRTAILKEFDTGAVAVTDAAKAAAKDGTVTGDEAKQVRTQARALGKQMKDKYAPKADKKSDKTAKGDRPHGKSDKPHAKGA